MTTGGSVAFGKLGWRSHIEAITHIVRITTRFQT